MADPRKLGFHIWFSVVVVRIIVLLLETLKLNNRLSEVLQCSLHKNILSHGCNATVTLKIKLCFNLPKVQKSCKKMT